VPWSCVGAAVADASVGCGDDETDDVVVPVMRIDADADDETDGEKLELDDAPAVLDALGLGETVDDADADRDTETIALSVKIEAVDETDDEGETLGLAERDVVTLADLELDVHAVAEALLEGDSVPEGDADRDGESDDVALAEKHDDAV